MSVVKTTSLITSSLCVNILNGQCEYTVCYQFIGKLCLRLLTKWKGMDDVCYYIFLYYSSLDTPLISSIISCNKVLAYQPSEQVVCECHLLGCWCNIHVVSLLNMQHVLLRPLCIIILSLFHTITVALPQGSCRHGLHRPQRKGNVAGEPLSCPLQKEHMVSCC